ncbi:restriction endonuclease [Brevibacillus agri]|uniref:restriction endonuclease n=2 Tax=Brevibacillus TaxID=55080 RepID=UPI00046F21B8|nr:restriction endonuclease [Brevibacillus agri]
MTQQNHLTRMVFCFAIVETCRGYLLVAGIAFGILLGLAKGIRFWIDSIAQEKLRRSGIAEIDKMDGRQFEHYLGLLFHSQGYKTTVTRAAGDYGADLILEQNGRKVAVQAKRYSKNVGIDAVQQIVGALAHYGANAAWVVTNRDFTDAAYKLAASNGVRLINREALIEMIQRMNTAAKPNPKQVRAQFPQQKLQCDRCGSQMVVRKSTKGEFYGCSSFPKCRNTKAV